MRLILPIWILLLHMTCAWGLLIPQETRMGAEGWAAYSPSSTSTSTQASRSATRTVNYTYDDLHRLTSEVLGGSEETGTVAYTLDDVGNRLGRTSSVAGITPQSLSYSANDWLNSHQYDANGNTLRSDLTSGSVARDAYDFKNRLSQRRIYDASGTVLQKIIDLRYDGDGSLKWKRVTDTTTGEESIRYFVVDHHNLTGYSQIVEELDATGAVVATYHYGHDLISQSRLVVDPASGSSEWVDRIFVYDGGGHVRALTDLEGNITDTFSYDAYGNLLQPSSLFLPTSYLYRGERYDPDLGQYYLRARFYDASLGRFHTLDEYEGRTGEPLSLHKYLYAHGNPVTGWDPSGRMSLAQVSVGVAIYLGTTLQLGRMGRGGGSSCGPDVTEPLSAVIRRIRRDFGRLTSFQQTSLCNAAQYPPYAIIAWDIIELHDDGNTTSNETGCVEVDGNCVGTSRANYIMWGTISSLCGFSEWMMRVGVDISKATKLSFPDYDSLAYSKLGFDGWPDSGVRIPFPGNGFYTLRETGSGKYTGRTPWSYRWYPVFGDGFGRFFR